MISDDWLHKTRFCKKKGANQNFPHKKGGWSKRGGGLNNFVFRGGGGDSYPDAHYETPHFKVPSNTDFNFSLTVNT